MGKLQTGTSIFTTMSKMASEHKAINLSQGFPNFAIDERLTDIFSRIVTTNVHQYMPSAGFPPLLERVAKLIANTYGRNVGALTDLLITAGATQGIFTAIQALVNPGDEVIILDPAYDCYDAPIILCGAKPIHIPLTNDFLPDWHAIANAVNDKTRMIIINNPHNPSGKTWNKEDFEQLETLLEHRADVLVLSDEVYEFIAFENAHISVNSRPKLRDRSIVVSSFGKSFHITGWKIGYLIAPETLMSDIKKVHQFLVFSVNSVTQAVIAEYLDIVDLTGLGDFYKTKRDYFRELLTGSRFKLLPCEGSYFQVASYSGISDESDIDFTKRLVIEKGVAAIPLSVFYESKKDDKLIRFCFAKDNLTLEQAAERLRF
jgi:methionine aminotransferase